jgi:uncharacterized membrane protein
MKKHEFLQSLNARLERLPERERRESLAYYEEMIDDRMEEGFSEDAAVAAVGTLDEAVLHILEDIPMTRLLKKSMMPSRRLRAWEIVLLILGSPIWISLIAAVFACVIAVYASLWSVVISLFAVNVSLAVAPIGGILVGFLQLFGGRVGGALFLIGASLLSVGLAIFFFFICRGSVLMMAKLSRGIWMVIKRMFVGKGAVR